ncbi:methyltransferase domain-containing protein [Amycolatopsis samaneae]|uniref:Protein-L-isoaspartate O-methyltransferase n=1 Tax=Amycolatopsis samaneae TaxID=664691 RepID=A0ABW5GNP2_9PSEU
MNSTSGPGDLVAELRSAGNLPAECYSAFETVKREYFVPNRVWTQETDDSRYEPVDRATEPERWSSLVYSDRVIVTQFDDGDPTWPDVGFRPTSSASMPSAVAGMLGALDAQPGESVLEIGTGTGFNAALISELVGPEGNVTSIEIDENIGKEAKRNLETAGYSRVDVEIQDATFPIGRRFDRIIATAGVHLGQLPFWWVKSANVILAPMRADLSSGPLVKFEIDDGVARGRAVGMRVGFMEMRSQRVRSMSHRKLRWDDEQADRSTTDVNPFVVLLNESSRWAASVAVPMCRYDLEKPTEERDHGVAWLVDPISGSWATVAPEDEDSHTVRQFGPRRLWNETESAYRWWVRKGKPAIESWEWTVSAERQSIQLATE